MHDDSLHCLEYRGTVRLESFTDGRDGGHDPRSAYVERFWLPLLGPSTLLLVRQLAFRLAEGETEVELGGGLKRALGLGDPTARRGAFVRTLTRARNFDMVRLGPRTLAVRREVPSLRPRQLERLPAALQAKHPLLKAPASPHPSGSALPLGSASLS